LSEAGLGRAVQNSKFKIQNSKFKKNENENKKTKIQTRITYRHCSAREENESHGSDYFHGATFGFHDCRICLGHKVERL
jgi:hypothetical protein